MPVQKAWGRTCTSGCRLRARTLRGWSQSTSSLPPPAAHLAQFTQRWLVLTLDRAALPVLSTQACRLLLMLPEANCLQLETSRQAYREYANATVT